MNNNKKIIMHCFLTTITLLFIKQNSMAGADWKEKQEQMFSQIPVNVGDVIDQSNWEKAKNLLPDPVLNEVKAGEWNLEIGEFEYDHDYDAEYYELSAKNAGKYALGEKKQIIDIKTGKFPLFIRGMPFPEIDIKNDPDGPVKFMHNKEVNLHLVVNYFNTTYPDGGNLQWVGRGGYERGVAFLSKVNYWWNRSRGEIPNPRELKYTYITVVGWPYDLYGTSTLYMRHLDGRDDSAYAYVPSIRRIKRLSGANRSDPQMGSDQCMDDAQGFSGHIESMKWYYIGEKIMLKPVAKEDAKVPQKIREEKTRGWSFVSHDRCTIGDQVDGWSGAPWAYTNIIWVPREMYIIKAEPLDPYYAFGTLELYIDKLTTQTSFNLKYTRSGEFWKILFNTTIPVSWKNGQKIFSMDGPMEVIDKRTNHASVIDLDDMVLNYDSPLVKPASHTPQNLKTFTK